MTKENRMTNKDDSLSSTTTMLGCFMECKLSPECMDKKDTSLPEDLADIVRKHALGAAATGFAANWVPAAGILISASAMAGIIWMMYLRINHRIGLKFSKVWLKTFASAMASNLLQSAMGTFLIAGVLSVTGVGSPMAIILGSAVEYAVVMVSGIVYLKLMNELFNAGRNPEEMSERELEIAAKDVMKNTDIKSLLRKSKKEYEINRKNGTFTGTETCEFLKKGECYDDRNELSTENLCTSY